MARKTYATLLTKESTTLVVNELVKEIMAKHNVKEAPARRILATVLNSICVQEEIMGQARWLIEGGTREEEESEV